MGVKFSIITVCLNAEKTIEETLLSVQNQTYSNVEHVIIDGGSKDDTVSVVEHHRERTRVVLSEQDFGIYDAMNKGVALTSGAYLMFLNADDYLYDEHVLADVAQFLDSHPGVDLLYGGVVLRDPADQFSVKCCKVYSIGKLKRGSHPPHQACFFSAASFRKFGGYAQRFRICDDYDLIARYYLGSACIRFVDRMISVYGMTGISSRFYADFASIGERYALLRTYFDRWTAYAYWLRSRRQIGRELGKQVLIRLGLLKYWRKFKIATGFGSRTPDRAWGREPGVHAVQANAVQL